MNIHNELYFMYKNGKIGNREILNALDQGIISQESYRVITEQPVEWTLEQTITHKVNELNYYCNKNIVAGVDVELEDGSVEHFSLTSDDQNNINSKQMDIILGAKTVVYHADGCQFKEYSASDMRRICVYAKSKIDAETAYRNNLREWIKKLTDIDKIRSIRYGDLIPEEHWTDGWRLVQETLNVSMAKSGDTMTEPVVLGDDQPTGDAEAEEEPKENIMTKAVKAVTGKSRKKKNEE